MKSNLRYSIKIADSFLKPGNTQAYNAVIYNDKLGTYTVGCYVDFDFPDAGSTVVNQLLSGSDVTNNVVTYLGNSLHLVGIANPKDKDFDYIDVGGCCDYYRIDQAIVGEFDKEFKYFDFEPTGNIRMDEHGQLVMPIITNSFHEGEWEVDSNYNYHTDSVELPRFHQPVLFVLECEYRRECISACDEGERFEECIRQYNELIKKGIITKDWISLIRPFSF